MKQALKRIAGAQWQYLRVTRQLLRAFAAGYGQYDRECPLCLHQGRFLAEVHFPDIFNFDALCPSCGSLPRNRLLWLAIGERGLVGKKDALLHFAPEECLSGRLQPLAGRYDTADLFAAGVDHKLNIEEIAQPDGSWDAIICSHVLEHVDDRKAVRELYRILRPGGRLMILVPVAEGWDATYENARTFDPAMKALHYGKDNHVRRFGRDIRDRLSAAGFEVEAYSLDGERSVRYGLLPGENLFICQKAAG